MSSAEPSDFHSVYVMDDPDFLPWGKYAGQCTCDWGEAHIVARLAPGQVFPDVTHIMTGIDLQGTPPCEILIGVPGAALACGKPSEARLRITMPCCGTRYVRFVCAQCIADLGDAHHTWLCEEGCNRVVTPTWTVI